LKQSQEEIEQIDKEIEAEKAAAPEEPEDEYQSFTPKGGKPLNENKIHNLKERISNVG
jgi:hypothetical protein